MTVFKHGDPVRMWAHTLTPHTTGTVTGTTPEGRVLVRWDDNHAITEQVPHYLEPLGEPMSKTFHSVIQDDESARTFEVGDSMSGRSIHLVIRDGAPLSGIFIPADDAPALALAILQAAGVKAQAFGSANYAEVAVANLTMYVDEMAHAAKEAADREALEGDAVRLHDAWRSELRNMTTTAWGELGANHRAAWIGVALAARAVREITGAKA